VPTADEHDRYQRLTDRLAAEDEPSDAFVAAFMEDVGADPDPVMAESATIALLDHPALAQPRLDRIASVMPQGWMAAAARLEERRLQLEIEANPNDIALWDRAVRSRSRRLHLWLLEQPSVPDETLEILASQGATKAVRNRASEALRRRSGA
jgi:hypothetical protein